MKFNLLKASIASIFSGLCSFSSSASLDNDEQWQLIDTYCIECHNYEDYSGGLAFEVLNRDDLHEDAEVWEEVISKLQSRMMPPDDQPQPDVVSVNAFVEAMAGSLDTIAQQNPEPGSTVLHRLNRAEYQNAIRDLLDLKVDAQLLLPADDSSAGFDNIANVLNVSPALMQAYISAAAKVSRMAIGDMTTSASVVAYRPPAGVSQAFHREGLPLGTRGGILVEHVFPLDAEYEFSVRRSGANGFSLPVVGLDEAMEITIDGERVRLLAPGANSTMRLSITAGPHKIGAAIVDTQRARGVDDLNSVLANSTAVQSISITGPFNSTGPGSTPSRSKIFVCRPEISADERPCAGEILRALATRAFRQPVDEVSLDILLQFYEDGLELNGFETGIQYALARILVDPQFMFRFEAEPAYLEEGEIYQVNDFELASRLSFFLWSSIPDDELLAVANSGRLSNPEVLQGQVSRMLADPKSDALVENFAAQWLSLRQLDSLNPVAANYDGRLRQSFKRETELLLTSILREDRSIIDLLDADYTFVDERLAEHYGIVNIRGSRFRRVEIKDPNRRGLLGHGSILTLTSAPNRTSPVMRGKWVLENILGAPPPPPPPGVETNLDETAIEGKVATTIRQRLELHRDNPSCAACHRMIDPIGFALENFDSVGQWRDTFAGQKVDASGELWDGTPLTGPESLRLALLKRSDLFVANTTEKLMTYALGRTVEYYDMPAIRKIVRNAGEDNYKLSALISGIVASSAFQMRKKTSSL